MMYPTESRRGSGLRNSRGQAYDVGLQGRRFIVGLQDDLSIATEHCAQYWWTAYSQGEERDSPKKPDCPGKTKAAPVRAGGSEQSSLHPGLSRSEATRASSQLRPMTQANKPTQVQSPRPAVQVRARTHTETAVSSRSPGFNSCPSVSCTEMCCRDLFKYLSQIISLPVQNISMASHHRRVKIQNLADSC